MSITALTSFVTIVYSSISDWKQWRWQVYVFIVSIHVVSIAVLAALMAFNFLTTAFPILMSWLGDILRKEPEACAIVVGASVTIVYASHAMIPLRAQRVADSPAYPIGFPLTVSFMRCGIMVVLLIVWYLRKFPDLLVQGIGDTVNEDELVTKWSRSR